MVLVGSNMFYYKFCSCFNYNGIFKMRKTKKTSWYNLIEVSKRINKILDEEQKENSKSSHNSS